MGYRKKLRSANQLAEACKINIEVMWLLRGMRPSARTINYFRSNNTRSNRKGSPPFREIVKAMEIVGWGFNGRGRYKDQGTE